MHSTWNKTNKHDCIPLANLLMLICKPWLKVDLKILENWFYQATFWKYTSQKTQPFSSDFCLKWRLHLSVDVGEATQRTLAEMHCHLPDWNVAFPWMVVKTLIEHARISRETVGGITIQLTTTRFCMWLGGVSPGLFIPQSSDFFFFSKKPLFTQLQLVLRGFLAD